MAKVINTILNLRDNMSKGLLSAARNTEGVSREMRTATREVINFKNKASKAMSDFAKKSAVDVGAAAGALTAGFLAMDGATEEYRIAQGKLNTAFDAANMSADAARASYRNFYAILGDSDTATEASQLLAKLTRSEEDITKWTKISAGVLGTFGDSLPIEGLIEASNETAKVGTVTGVLADALNWVGISEDKFNEQLEKAGSEASRNKLIMDTLSTSYDKASDAFYANNQQVINSRRNQATLQEVTAKLGDASAKVKNDLWALAGAQEDGSIRAGSALDFLYGKIDEFSSWISGLNLTAFTEQADQVFSELVDKATSAINWLRDNKDTVITTVQHIVGAFALFKGIQITGNFIGAIQTIGNFGKTVGLVAASNLPKLGAGLKTAGGAISGFGSKIIGLIAANPVILGIVAAIAAAIAIGVLLYKNWDKIKAGALALWESAKSTFNGFKESISSAFQAVKDKTSELWGAITETFTGIKDSIVGAFDAAKEKVSGFFSWLDDKISSVPVIGNIYEGGKGAISWVAGKLAGNALGTSYWRGGLTRINERGGEIIDLPSGTRIIPHDISTKAAESFGSAARMLADRTRRIALGQMRAQHPIVLGSAPLYTPQPSTPNSPIINVKVEVQGNMIGNEQYADEMGEIIVGKILAAHGNM